MSGSTNSRWRRRKGAIAPSLNPQSAIRNPQSRRGGFTLIEATLVIVIVGVGVLAMVSAQQAYHQENGVSQRMGTALLLASEIRELTLSLPQDDPITGSETWGPEANELTVMQYDDLDDFDGADSAGTTFAPPISALRQVIPNMDGWSQVVTVENVPANDLSTLAPLADGASDVVRITARIFYLNPGEQEPREITRLVWTRAGGP